MSVSTFLDIAREHLNFPDSDGWSSATDMNGWTLYEFGYFFALVSGPSVSESSVRILIEIGSAEIRFYNSNFKSMYDDITHDLVQHENGVAMEELYQEAVDMVKKNIEASDMANSYVGLSSSYPGLWKKVDSGKMSIGELEHLIEYNDWT